MVALKEDRSYKVLMVDDDPGTIELLESTFEIDRRYALYSTGDAADALRVCRTEQPGIVLMDNWLPGTDAIAACRQIKDEPSWAGTSRARYGRMPGPTVT